MMRATPTKRPLPSGAFLWRAEDSGKSAEGIGLQRVEGEQVVLLLLL